MANNHKYPKGILNCNYKQKLGKIRQLKFHIILAFCIFSFYCIRFKDSKMCSSFEQMVLEKVNMDSECLIKHIRSSKVVAPSSEPYNLTKRIYSYLHSSDSSDAIQSLKKEIDAPWVQALIAVETFVPKRGQRTFLECGALDGVKYSATLHLERFLNWTGVLIESDDKFFTEMTLAHRKAYGVHACISSEEHPTIEYFISTPFQYKINGINRIIVNDAPGNIPKHNLRGMALKLQNLITGDPVPAQCLPLYSILLAVNISVIDLLVLDSKSLEFEVLKTIPFQKIDVAVLLIETYRKTTYQKEITHAYLKSQGYIYYDSFRNVLHPGDDIFLNEKYLKKGASLTNLSLSNYFKILTGKEKKEALESEFESFENYVLPILV